jgi:iron complex outermembrane receptor protein
MSGINDRILVVGLAAVLAGGVMIATPTAAAEPADPSATPAAGDQLQEVVVTAERRSENPQSMSVSVVAFSNADLRNNGIQTVADLQALVPSLTFVDGANAEFINIRGVGLNESAPNQTDGVASYLDGAYIAREFTSDDAYFDLASVSVLRGPQGTYVGQNATGGAIFMTTNAPELNKTSGYAQQTFGAYGERETEGAISVPLGQTLAARVSLLSETRDSFTNNLGPDGSQTSFDVTNHPGNLTRLLGRTQLLWEPSEDLKLRVIYQNSARNSDGVPSVPNTPASFDNPFTASWDYPQADNVHYQRTTAILDWQAAAAFKLHAVSAYQAMDEYLQMDNDGTSPLVQPTAAQQAQYIHIRDQYFTNEADLVSTNAGPLQWTAGLAQLAYHQAPATLQIVTYNTPANPAVTPDFVNQGLYLDLRTFRLNQSGFGEISYDITPSWQLKVGARYSHDVTGLESGSYLQFAGPNGFKVPAGPNEPSFNAETGRVVLNWKPSNNELVYLTASRGYKPGGWTPDIGGPPTGDNVYNAEYVWNYEAGWKVTLLDGHLRSAFDGFYMDYNGFQATVATDPQNPATSVTENVQGTKIKGLEEEFEALAGGWRLSLGATYLDAKFGNLAIFMPAGTAGADQLAPELINLDGRTIDYAPKLSGHATLQYTVAAGQYGTITPKLDWSYQGGVYTSFFDQPYQYLPAHALGSFRLIYAPNAAWELQAYVTNITDRTYLANAYGGTPGAAQMEFGAPRQEGVLVRYEFGDR